MPGVEGAGSWNGDTPLAIVFEGIFPGKGGRAPERLVAGGGGGAKPGVLAPSEAPSLSSAEKTKSPM